MPQDPEPIETTFHRSTHWVVFAGLIIHSITVLFALWPNAGRATVEVTPVPSVVSPCRVLPEAVSVAPPESDQSFPLPESSVTVVPAPVNPYAASGAGGRTRPAAEAAMVVTLGVGSAGPGTAVTPVPPAVIAVPV